MIRDLAEDTVDGSAFDDFSASPMLGDRLRLCLIGLFKVPMIRILQKKQLMDQLLMITVLFYVGNNRDTVWGYV